MHATLTANRPIRVGIVGLSAHGGWAARSHLPALRAIPGYRVEGVAASTPEASRAATEAHGIPLAFGSVDELAASDRIDLAVVAVRVPEHAVLLDPILAAGKPVYCEWPLGRTLTEAQSLTRAADRAGAPTYVGLQGRSAPAILYLRDLVHRGAIGRVLSSTMTVWGAAWGPRADARSAYLREAATGASLLSIAGGHALDALAFCLGEFTEVTATTAVRRREVPLREGGLASAYSPDQVALTGALHSGAVVAVHLRGGRGDGPGFVWEIAGEEGELIVTGADGMPQHGRLRVLGAIDGAAMTALAVPREFDLAPGLAAASDSSHSVANAYSRLRAGLAAGEVRVPTFVDAVARHRLLQAIEEAAAHGCRIRLSD